MSHPATTLTTQAAIGRGERLYPAPSSRLYWHLTALRQSIERVIAEHIVPLEWDTLVDFGCGNMPYRALFEAHLAKYVGCDLEGNEMAEAVMSTPGQIPMDDQTADIVLSSQVLEHVSDPAGYLAEAFRVLRPGGLLLLSTHGSWRYHPDPCDFWRWTCDGLRRIVQNAAFEIDDFQGVMGPEATALQLWQDAVADRVPHRLRSLFYRYVQWRIRKADMRCSDIHRNRDACVYVVVARKPAE